MTAEATTVRRKALRRLLREILDSNVLLILGALAAAIMWFGVAMGNSVALTAALASFFFAGVFFVEWILWDKRYRAIRREIEESEEEGN